MKSNLQMHKGGRASESRGLGSGLPFNTRTSSSAKAAVAGPRGGHTRSLPAWDAAVHESLSCLLVSRRSCAGSLHTGPGARCPSVIPVGSPGSLSS